MILTDILGGTATNLSLSFLENKKIELGTGLNLPMLLTPSSDGPGRSLRGWIDRVNKNIPSEGAR